MNKKLNKKTGQLGEDLTADYIINLGYKILARNLILTVGEIDILAEDHGTIVIIEVKTVRGEGFGEAVELVRYKKQKKLKLLANALTQRYPNKTIRIDVSSVFLGSTPRIDYFENAVYD